MRDYPIPLSLDTTKHYNAITDELRHGGERINHRREEKSPVLIAEDGIRTPFGMGHHAKDVTLPIADAGDVITGPIGIVLRGQLSL